MWITALVDLLQMYLWGKFEDCFGRDKPILQHIYTIVIFRNSGNSGVKKRRQVRYYLARTGRGLKVRMRLFANR